jgi:hypothetical protein
MTATAAQQANRLRMAGFLLRCQHFPEATAGLPPVGLGQSPESTVQISCFILEDSTFPGNQSGRRSTAEQPDGGMGRPGPACELTSKGGDVEPALTLHFAGLRLAL